MGRGISRATSAAGLALVIVIGACVGSDPAVSSPASSNDGGPTTDGTTSSSGGQDSGGGGDTGVDADLPPKAEGNFKWATNYSTASQVATIAAAGDSVVLATSFKDSATFDGVKLTANAGGAIPHDFAVMKLDATGKTGTMAPQWIRWFSGDGFDGPTSIVTDAMGDVYVAGSSVSSSLAIDGTPFLSRPSGSTEFAFAIKLSGSNGNKVWARTFAGPDLGGCNDIAVNGSTVALACTFFGGSVGYTSTTNVSASLTGLGGARDAYFFALDAADGKAKWANAIGNASGNGASSVAVTTNGDVLASAVFGDVALTDRAGSTQHPTPKGSNYNGFVARLAAADGKMVWVSTYGDVATGSAFVQVNDIAFADGHDIVVGGIYSGAAGLGGATAPPVAEGDDVGGNAFVLSLDPANGNTKWQKAFGGATNDEVSGVAIDRFGYVGAVARYKSTGVTIDGANLPDAIDGNTNAVALKWSPDGTQLAWNRALVPTGQAVGTGPTAPAYVRVRNIVMHANGEVSYGGGFDGSLDLGGGNAFTTTRESAFVVHTSP